MVQEDLIYWIWHCPWVSHISEQRHEWYCAINLILFSQSHTSFNIFIFHIYPCHYGYLALCFLMLVVVLDICITYVLTHFPRDEHPAWLSLPAKIYSPMWDIFVQNPALISL